MTSATRFFDNARELLAPRERAIIEKHISTNNAALYQTLLYAHAAAKEKQRACEDRQWTWKIHGRTITLREEAAKVVSWLDRFRQIGDIAVNFDPVHASLPWAGIRLVLEVVVTESRQMGALIVGMQTALHMTHRIRVYLSYLDSLPSGHATSAFTKTLLNLFALVLSFLARAIRTFEQSTAKRTLDSFFNGDAHLNFKLECDRLSQQVEIDASNCDRQLLLIDREDAAHQRTKLNETLAQLENIAGIQLSIDTIENRQVLSKLPIAEGASFDSYEEQYNSLCLEGTRTEILEAVGNWSVDPDAKCIFWLNGMAGTGKSTISRSVAKSLQEQGRLAASFLFKRGEADRGNARKLLTTVALQIARNIPETQAELVTVIDAEPEISQKSLPRQFETLISGPLSVLEPKYPSKGPPVIVLDALDECDGDRDIRSILRMFAQAKSEIGVLVFITSRPEVPIRLGFAEMSGAAHQEVVLQEVAALTIRRDIKICLEHEFGRIRTEYSLRRPGNSLPLQWPGSESIEALVRLADPLFIFAMTMCRFIADPKGVPKTRLEKILAQPSTLASTKLDQTYQPILDTILADQDEDDDNFVQELKGILGAIITLAEPLSIRALSCLLKVQIDDMFLKLDFLHSVIRIPQDENTPIRLLHLSFRDYLLDERKREKNIWWIDGQQYHAILAHNCLELLSSWQGLKADIFDLGRPGVRKIEVGEQAIKDRIPAEMAYACIYWPYHWHESQQSIVDNGPVHGFLQKHLLHWIEILAWLGSLNQSVTQMANLCSGSMIDKKTDVAQLLDASRRFVIRNRKIIQEAPLQLYSSALMFMPEQNTVRQKFFQSINKPAWMKTLPIVVKKEGADIQALYYDSDKPDEIAYGLEFSRDGSMLASVTRTGAVRLWNILTGESCGEYNSDESGITDYSDLVFSPDGNLLAFSAYETVMVWDMEVMPRHLISLPGDILLMRFSRDGSLLAIAGQDGRLRFVNVKSNKVEWVSDILWPKPGFWTQSGGWDFSIPVAISLSERWVLAAVNHAKNEIQVWNTASGLYPQKSQKLQGALPIALSPDGQNLLFTSHVDDKMVHICRDSSLQPEVFTLRVDSIGELAFSPDGQIIVLQDQRTVTLWNVKERRLLQEIPFLDFFWSMAISPSNNQLAAGGRSAINLYEIRTKNGSENDQHLLAKEVAVGEDLRFSSEGMINVMYHHGAISEIATSEEAKYAASTDHLDVILWEWTTGRSIGRLKPSEGIQTGPCISPDGKLLATVSQHHTTRIWSVPGLEELCVLSDSQHHRHRHVDRRIAFSHDSALLASVPCPRFDDTPIVTEQALQIFDLTTKTEVILSARDVAAISQPIFSWNDHYLALWCHDSSIRVWDLRTTATKAAFVGSGRFHGLAFSHDNKLLAIGTKDGVQIYNISTDNRVPQITVAVENHPWSFFFSKDTEVILVYSYEVVSFYKISTREKVRSIRVPFERSSYLKMSEDMKHIFTDVGCIHLDDDCFDVQNPCSENDNLFLSGHWITYRGKDSLWLPPDHRPMLGSASIGKAIAVGQDSGIVNIYGV